MSVVPPQGAAVSEEESLGARQKLESQDFWIPRAGGHKAWLKALCTALLDSGGVKSEALLLSRPLCLVSTQTFKEALFCFLGVFHFLYCVL